MIKSIKIFVLFFLTIHVTQLLARDIHYENLTVGKIDVVVVNPPPGTTFNAQAVRSRMKTKEEDLFSQANFDSDLKILAQEYDRIEPNIEVVNGKIFIKLNIWLKPRIRIIQFYGNQHFPSADLQKELGMAQGTVFDRMAFNRAFHKLKGFYVKKGFFEAQLDYEVSVDPLANEIDITVNVCEGRSGKIKEIIFHNFNCKEECDILELMITKKWNFFTSWVTDTGIYNEEAMQQDQYMITNYLQNEGFADAEVTVQITEATANNRIVIDITANKGALYSLGKLTFEGNTIFSNEDILTQFTICEDSPYSPDQVRQTMLNIVGLYGRYGYIEALVDYEPVLESELPVYSIHFKIEEGEVYNVGLIKIFGNCSTQANVILHETLLTPGELFNTDKLKKTEERLQNIGYFKRVNVYAVRSEEENSCLGGNYRDVHIEVEETSTGNFSGFVGVSNVEKFFAGINVTEKNFNYKGLPNFIKDGYRALRGGGEYAHVTTTIGSKSRSYVLAWTKPYFRDTPWIVGFDLERSNVRYISDDYDINSWGGVIHAKYPINPYLQFGWHYRLRNSDVKVHGDGDESRQLLKEAKNSGLISASGISLTYDSTDNPQAPCKGFRSRLELEYAGLGGDHSFFGIGYSNSWFFPVLKKGNFKVRADTKYILPVFGTTYSNMPIDERLFLGGDSGVRGYRAYALGPKFKHTHDPRGGLSMSLFSLEYDHRLSPRWEVFVFFDAGYLSKRMLNFGAFKTSIGYGVRCKILPNIPPLTVGMGYPLNARSRGDVKRFFFSVGGNF